MSGEEDRAVIHHFYELLNSGQLDQIDSLFTSDYIDHNPQVPSPSLEGLKQLLGMVTSAFPDFNITVEDMIDEGDKVVARLSLRGTQKGMFMDIPQTGRQVMATGLSIFRLVDGMIAEEWFIFDALGLAQQLRAAPPSIEQNKAVIRRFYEELLSQGDLSVADELCTPDFIAHFLPPGMPSGVAGLKQLLSMYRAAFPDLESRIEDLIAQEDTVVARAVTRGTNQGEFLGNPPTGKQVAVAGIDMFRLENGKIVEQWLNRDDLGLMQQVGLMPVPGQPSAQDPTQ